MPVGPSPRRRVVEESLGEAVVKGIDDFVFHDIESEEAASRVFDFILDPDARLMLATALRGVRWQQKVGLVLARHKGHPAHAAQIRSQVIEYGAITELLLREAVRQVRSTGVPATFHGLIQRAESAGILNETGADAAHRRRDARNSVHLDPTRPPPKLGDGAKAMKDFVVIVNQCRSHSGRSPWQPVRRTPASG